MKDLWQITNPPPWMVMMDSVVSQSRDGVLTLCLAIPPWQHLVHIPRLFKPDAIFRAERREVGGNWLVYLGEGV